MVVFDDYIWLVMEFVLLQFQLRSFYVIYLKLLGVSEDTVKLYIYDGFLVRFNLLSNKGKGEVNIIYQLMIYLHQVILL